MISSPFEDAANATLIFKQLSTQQIVTDPETGNEHPLEELFQLEAKLKPPTTKAIQMTMPGPDTYKNFFEGRAVNPMHFPQFVRVGDRAKCTIRNMHSSTTQSGVFEVTSLNQSPWGAVTEFLGDQFEGYFWLE